MKRQNVLAIMLFTLVLTVQGQDKNFKRIFLEAEYYIVAADYQLALQNYETLLATDPENANLNFLVGYCLLKMDGDIELVIDYLEKAIISASPDYKDGSYKERNAPKDSHFLLGRAYHINHQFAEAIEAYTRYSNAIDGKEFAEVEYVNAHIKACELGRSMMNHPVDASFSAMGNGFDFEGNVYNPVISGDDSLLIFLADHNNSLRILASHREADSWSKPLVINPQLGLAGTIYPVSISYDGKELYLLYDDYYNSDIYVSHYKNGRWNRAQKLNSHINTKYTESHAALSKDGTRLFFTSDRRGGVGGLDIYVSERTAAGEWGEAVNLGHSINTYYNEESPFLTEDDRRLFFSSQGHNTMGGYDIFCSRQNVSGSWDLPVNIGYPVNSTDDDLFFNPGWTLNPAYYAKKSEDHDGRRNIFKVALPSLEVMEESSDLVKEEHEQILPDSLKRGAGEMQTSDLVPNASDTALTPKRKRVSFSSLGIYYTLNNILFDYNSSTMNRSAIREVERIYMLMRKYPEIGIELTGHADAKGPSEYNLELSNKRAQSVADYLLSKNIESNRISVRAAGESEPVAINQYEDGSDAPEGRELNRHVSITINNLSTDRIRVADIFVPKELIPKEDQGFTILLFQSSGRVLSTPEVFLDKQVSMISTDNSYIYAAGEFKGKSDAIEYLNEVIDQGYPDAKIIERRDLEQLIWSKSGTESFDQQSYTIQFMALSKPRKATYFKDLPDVRRYDCTDGLYRYVTGTYSQIEHALQDLPKVKALGYKQTMIKPCSRYEAISKK